MNMKFLDKTMLWIAKNVIFIAKIHLQWKRMFLAIGNTLLTKKISEFVVATNPVLFLMTQGLFRHAKAHSCFINLSIGATEQSVALALRSCHSNVCFLRGHFLTPAAPCRSFHYDQVCQSPYTSLLMLLLGFCPTEFQI